jgi:predicted ester cyclase
MSEEENKALARHLMQAVWKQGALDVVDEILTPDFVDHSLLPGQASSREGYKQSAAEFYAAFSFADFTIEAQIAEGDKVVTRFSTRCIQRGEFLGVPPSGERGKYRFESNVPVSYGGRPPHIHVRVTAPGYEELVTQHYPQRGQRKANFDLVLVGE